jgi:hypothetical protein
VSSTVWQPTFDPIFGVPQDVPKVAPEMHVLKSEAREFLIAQDTAYEENFLSATSAAMVDAMMDWRAQVNKERLSIATAQKRLYRWKRSLREQQSSMQEEPFGELDADLKKLSQMARDFLSSQGITTAECFL